MRQSTIARWCERIIEGGWLFALVLIPSYFNLLSSRHFEPDKATSLRAIVLIMVAAALVYWLDTLGSTRQATAAPPETPPTRWWRRFVAFPMALPTLVYSLVFLIATVLSVTPWTSLWGSYQRLQGTYTNLAYIGLGTLIVLFLRRREQLERLVMVAVLGALPAIGYGLIQHFQIDPLPWRGDVITRVASTMGNSIFVSAYLIMVLPFACYLAISGFASARATTSERRTLDVGWAAAYTLAVGGALLIVYGAVCFGAVVRVPDLRYWWVYPGALVVAFALFLLPTLRPNRAERIGLAQLAPGIVAIVYVLFLGLMFIAGQGSGAQQVQAMPGRGGTEWPLYIVAGLAAIIGCYVLCFTLPRGASESRLLLEFQGAGMALIAALMVVTIVFTQSRGPWLGGLAGMFVFFTALLLLAWRRARATDSPRASLWRNLLVAEVVTALALGGFLAAFNLSNAPVFGQLRDVPYIGRMGRLLETEEGTGLVRRLIWAGDEHGGGAIGLITSNPLRTIVGWGPESMFVAFNEFYPPSLANIEARGASPDRSHEAYLDELVTKGVLGLASYLFVIISALTLAVTLMRRVDDWQASLLLSACLAVIASHAVEGLTGIPIVATLMLLWVTIAVITSTGVVLGQYTLGTRPQPAAVPVEVQPAQAKNQTGNRRQRGAVARGATQNRAAPATYRRGEANPLSLLVYAIIFAVGLAAAWFTNVDNVYADMRFQQGQIYAEGTNADLRQQLVGTEYYADAIRMEPNQDFYYLSLGRNLMGIADIRRQMEPDNLGEPKADASLRELLQVDDLPAMLSTEAPLVIMSYAEAVLNRAYELNPLNKDHSANLGRLNSFWYARMQQDPARLQQAIDWYAKGNAIAPQDVVIMNEYAGAIVALGNYAKNQGDDVTAQAKYDQAAQLLARSKELDARFVDTDVRTADLLRTQGRTAEAVDRYIALLEQNPHALDNQYTLIAGGLRDQPEQLTRLIAAYEAALAKTPDDARLQDIIGRLAVESGDLDRAVGAFEQVVAADPQSIDARRNLLVVLSDTKQYARAADEADAMLRLAEANQNTDQAQQIQALAQYFRQLAGQP